MAKNRVQAQLADQGIPTPASLWTTTGRQWLEDLELPVVHRRVVSDCEALLAIAEARIAGLEAHIRDQPNDDPRVRRCAPSPASGN